MPVFARSGFAKNLMIAGHGRWLREESLKSQVTPDIFATMA
jgi:hypothetical protein